MLAPNKVQNLVLGLMEPHEVHMGLLLKFVQVLLDGILSLRNVSHTTQLGALSKCPESASDLTVSLMKILSSAGPNTEPLRDTTQH